MFIANTYPVAVFLCVLTMLCWGSWPNTQKLVSARWRFELFYWDYVWGITLASLLFAFTFGSVGSAGRGFIQDVTQAEGGHLLSALFGGVIFNAANILFVAAIAVSGIAVTFSVGAGFGLVLGVLVNYLASPGGQPYYLFGGMVLVVTAILLSAIAQGRLSRGSGTVTTKGFFLALVAGVLFGFFYRFLASAMVADFQSPEAGKLGPYTAVVLFAVGVALSNFLFNTILMRKPVAGPPVGISDYFAGSARDHLMGVVGGLIWGAGLLFSMLSADKAGFAISFGLSQGNAMIAAIWGVFIWKEFKEAPPKTNRLLYGMFACYIIGLVLIVVSKI